MPTALQPKPRRIAFRASATEFAQEACARLVARHGDAPLEVAQVVVALGGDRKSKRLNSSHG